VPFHNENGSPYEKLHSKTFITLMTISTQRVQEIGEKLPLELKGAVQDKIRLCKVPPINLHLDVESVVVLSIN